MHRGERCMLSIRFLEKYCVFCRIIALADCEVFDFVSLYILYIYIKKINNCNKNKGGKKGRKKRYIERGEGGRYNYTKIRFSGILPLAGYVLTSGVI